MHTRADVAAVVLAFAATSVLAADAPDAQGRRRGRMRSNDVDASTRLDTPGDHTVSLRHDGRTRQYLVHVPPQYRRGGNAPVVIGMHGGGGSMTQFANDASYGIVSKSNAVGFVAVFPNGISRLRSGALATWNAGSCCGRARDEDVDDVGFIRAMLGRLQQQLDIDPSRVFATGMSNGAMMAYRLACELPEIIAGIMAVAGTDGTTSCTPRRPVPVLHVHALNDDHVLSGGGAGSGAVDAAYITSFTSVPDTVSKWVRLNRAVPDARRVLTVAGARCDRHEATPGGAPVELCVTDTGGHSWPGGRKARATEAPSTAISATDIMWAFFSNGTTAK